MTTSVKKPAQPWASPLEILRAAQKVREEESSGVKRPYGDMRSRAEKIDDEIVKARVIDGIDLLEKTHGPGWADKIDVDLLDMASARRCVLGQLYGEYAQRDLGEEGYSYGTGKLGIAGTEFGFDQTEGASYGDLQEAWELVLDA